MFKKALKKLFYSLVLVLIILIPLLIPGLLLIVNQGIMMRNVIVIVDLVISLPLILFFMISKLGEKILDIITD